MMSAAGVLVARKDLSIGRSTSDDLIGQREDSEVSGVTVEIVEIGFAHVRVGVP